MKLPIRVLHVIGAMDCGGAETMIMNLYRQINKSKIQFDFVVHTKKKMIFEDEILGLGGKIYRLPKFTGINVFAYKKAWFNLFKNNDYKIIHGHIGSTAAIYLNIAKKYNIFSIAHSHGGKTPKTIKGILYSFLSSSTRDVADFFFACSTDAGIARYGQEIVDSNRFQVLKNAIKSDDFKFSISVRDNLRKILGLESKFVIGHVGRFVEQKNHVFLIDVFNRIYEKNNNARLLLVGDGELRTIIDKKIAEYGLSHCVIITGIQPNVSEYLQAMDVFVFPSINEGLGIVTIEAQASGLPCVVSEAIPKEAFITDLIKSIPLKESLDNWCKLILEQQNYFRKDKIVEVEQFGYDINETTEHLENFYKTKIEQLKLK